VFASSTNTLAVLLAAVTAMLLAPLASLLMLAPLFKVALSPPSLSETAASMLLLTLALTKLRLVKLVLATRLPTPAIILLLATSQRVITATTGTASMVLV